MSRRLCGVVSASSLAISLGLSVVAQAQDWELRVDEEHLRVETRSVGGSNFKAFRAQARIAATPEEVLRRLQDTAAYPEWFPDTIEARRIAMQTGGWANYVRTAAPWPVKDRDAVYTQRLQRDGERIHIDVGVAPDAVPEVADAVRVREAQGSWDLRPGSAPGTTQLTWEFHLEPGGSIPARLANTRVVETPRGALRALQAFFAPCPETDGSGSPPDG